MLTLNEVLSDFKDYAGLDEKFPVTVNSKGKDGKTPLHWMAILGDHKAIAILVKAGASVNEVDDAGGAPIHEAVFNRQATAVNELILSGADLTIKNNAGLTPKEIAYSDGFQPLVEFFKKLNI